jgi:tetrahydromethanopterin S-methyltransferase subunit H
MYSFTQEQKIVTINEIVFGGQPGEYPTVLFGGFFFKGTPDYILAEEHIKKIYHLSRQTGVPVIPDFFIRQSEYIPEILNFIKNVLPRDLPFSVDIIEPDIKIQTIQELKKEKLLDRTIYNSIHIGITEEEQQTLKNCTPKVAILVSFNPKDTSPDGKIEVLENGAHLRENGLFDIAQQCNISNILVDTAALAPGQNSGAAIAALPVIKEEYGLPVGCAIHNVVEKSHWLNKLSDARKLVDVASNINIPVFGGDFALFGPITYVEHIIPLIAWQDILISEYTEQYFGVKPVETHPRRILL